MVVQAAILRAVAGISHKDVYAVGNWLDQNDIQHPLIVHWNGEVWRMVDVPEIGDSDDLYGVAVLPNGDAWAVGNWNDGRGGGSQFTLAYQYDKSQNVWKLSNPAPQNPMSIINRFYAVTAIDEKNVWAVGQASDDSNPDITLIEHWDGATWTIFPSPNAANNNALYGVSANSADSVLAVGWSGGVGSRMLVERFDPINQSWAMDSLPQVQPFIAVLAGVAGKLNARPWAVGTQGNPIPYMPLIVRSKGKVWEIYTKVTFPPLALLDALFLNAVTAVGKDAWAVGYHSFGNGMPTYTVVLQFDPISGMWKTKQHQSFNNQNTSLNGIAVISNNKKDVWAVGNCGFHSFTEHWDGNVWKQYPSP